MRKDPLPLVSVITPSLNQARFIEETIRSVRDQDYSRLQHIIVDGGSTDETLRILRGYDHLVWISEPDRGQAEAVNKGWLMAEGQILGWLNSDDMYAPGTVPSAVRYLIGHPEVDLVYGDCHVVDEIGATLEVRRSRPYNFRRLIVLDDNIPQPSIFFRRSVLDRVGMLDTRLQLAMDFNFWVRVARRCQLEYVPGLVARFRSHGRAKSIVRAQDFLAEILFTLDALFSDPDLPREVARLRAEAYSGAYVAGAIRSYASGDVRNTRRFLLRGFRYYPHPCRLRTVKGVLLLVDTLLGSKLTQHLKKFQTSVVRVHMP